MTTTRQLVKNASLFLFLLAGITACNKNEDVITPDSAGDKSKEYRFVRLLVSDETSNTLTHLTPFDAKTVAFQAKYPLANLYATASGRYAAVIHRNNDLVEIFDNGLLLHDDHVDIAG